MSWKSWKSWKCHGNEKVSWKVMETAKMSWNVMEIIQFREISKKLLESIHNNIS